MINCAEIIVVKEKFVRNISDNLKSDGIPVKLETNFAPNVDEESNDAKLELHLIVGGEMENEYPFSYEIKVAGIFNWSDIPKEEAHKEISTEGIEVIYSFIRTYFYEALKRGGMSTIVLPTLNADN